MSRSLSIYLDVLRFSAALWVFLAHVALLVPAVGLPHFWWTAEDAVMGFFVLSGFVVAYTSAHKHTALQDYFVARLSRLCSVAVPALLFAFVVDMVGRQVAPALDPGWSDENPLGRLLAGLLFVNELWFGSARAPSNVPYWSIGYEFWYYAMFGFAFYLKGAPRVLAVAAAAVIAGPKILMLAPVWLMGVIAYRLVGRVGPRAGWLLFIGSLVAYGCAYGLEVRPALEWRTRLMVPGSLDIAWSNEFWWKLLVGGMAAANIVGFAAISQRLSLRAIERPVRWLAGMTFSIYLFHWPLLLLVVIFSATWRWSEWPVWLSILVLAGVMVTIAALAELSERRKDVARQAIEAALALVLGVQNVVGKPPRNTL